MATRLNPYLTFRDTAREAIEFYPSVFGGELTMAPWGDSFGMSTDTFSVSCLVNISGSPS